MRLKLKDAIQQRLAFEQQYGMDFPNFKQAWEKGDIPDSTSYEVEQKYWEWEASITDENRLQKMLDTTAYALIRQGQRIFGADNTGGWHIHPFTNPARYDKLIDALSFADFAAEFERAYNKNIGN